MKTLTSPQKAPADSVSNASQVCGRGIAMSAVYWPLRQSAVTGPEVVQRQRTSIAVFGQTHDDKDMLRQLMQEIRLLEESGVPFTVVMEETPEKTLDDLIKRYTEIISTDGADLDMGPVDRRRAVEMAHEELPIIQYLKAIQATFKGVDAPRPQKKLSEDELAEMEFVRLQHMTNGIMGAAADLQRRGGGVVLGLNFGIAHIAGLLEMLNERNGQRKKGDQYDVQAAMAVGSHDTSYILSGARRTVKDQQQLLSAKKSGPASKLGKKLHTLIEDGFFQEEQKAARVAKGLTITHIPSYGTDVSEMMDNAISFSRHGKRGVAPAVMHGDDYGEDSHLLADEGRGAFYTTEDYSDEYSDEESEERSYDAVAHADHDKAGDGHSNWCCNTM